MKTYFIASALLLCASAHPVKASTELPQNTWLNNALNDYRVHADNKALKSIECTDGLGMNFTVGKNGVAQFDCSMLSPITSEPEARALLALWLAKSPENQVSEKRKTSIGTYLAAAAVAAAGEAADPVDDRERYRVGGKFKERDYSPDFSSPEPTKRQSKVKNSAFLTTMLETSRHTGACLSDAATVLDRYIAKLDSPNIHEQSVARWAFDARSGLGEYANSPEQICRPE